MFVTLISKTRIAVLLCGVLLVMFSQPGLDSCNAMEPEIQGLILNRAQTRFGHEFHRLFVSLWSPVIKESGYTIQIKEKASARWGSIIRVVIDDRVVCQSHFGARSQEMKQVVEQCVDMGQAYLYRLSHYKAALESEDIANDEF